MAGDGRGDPGCHRLPCRPNSNPDLDPNPDLGLDPGPNLDLDPDLASGPGLDMGLCWGACAGLGPRASRIRCPVVPDALYPRAPGLPDSWRQGSRGFGGAGGR